MINHNGQLLPAHEPIHILNRGFLYGDALFETFRFSNGKILFLEDHYFRLMASMRIVRMQIPMSFTMEFLELEIGKLVDAMNLQSARVRLTVYRNGDGFYSPQDNSVSFLIQASALEQLFYVWNETAYEVDLYKDFVVTKQLLSTLKTNNKILQVAASVYARENGLQNCLVINNDKNVAEAINGNLFLLSGNRLITPPLSEGCLNGIMRKQLLRLAATDQQTEVVQAPISPFDLQKADELFISNVITGIQPITQYRKKSYGHAYAKSLLEKLNQDISA